MWYAEPWFPLTTFGIALHGNDFDLVEVPEIGAVAAGGWTRRSPR